MTRTTTAIGDSSGVMHLLASQEGTAFNSFSQPTYFPTDNMINFPKVNVSYILFLRFNPIEFGGFSLSSETGDL